MAKPGTDVGMDWHADRENIKGTKGDDILEGDEFKNSIISAGDGDDIITDAGGENWIKGGDGNDIITTGYGKDLVTAGDGDDFIDPGANYDNVFGDAGNDTLIYNLSDLGQVPSSYPDTGAPFFDSYSGGEGNDTLNILMTQDHIDQGFLNYMTNELDNWNRAEPLFLDYNPSGEVPYNGNVMQLSINPDIETINIYQGSAISDIAPENQLYTTSNIVETDV